VELPVCACIAVPWFQHLTVSNLPSCHPHEHSQNRVQGRTIIKDISREYSGLGMFAFTDRSHNACTASQGADSNKRCQNARFIKVSIVSASLSCKRIDLLPGRHVNPVLISFAHCPLFFSLLGQNCHDQLDACQNSTRQVHCLLVAQVKVARVSCNNPPTRVSAKALDKGR